MSYAVATRDAVRAAPFLTALAPLGLVGIAMPVTKTAVVEDGTAIDQAVASLRPGDLVGLASARASEVIAEVAARRGLPLSGVLWWSVGDTTAEPLRRLGHRVASAARSSAAGLAAAMIAHGVVGRRVLLPRAEDGRPEAALLLRQAGAHVEEVVSYRTVSCSADDPSLGEGLARWHAGEVVVAALFAPSQVVALQEVLSARRIAMTSASVLFAAIGETTARALTAAAVLRFVVASAPTPQAMANAIATRYPPTR
jgi:uroporphyrinogen-III synthase